MKLDEMRRLKKEYGFTYEQIASISGVPVGTVQKVFTGATQSPRYDTILALEKVFESPRSMPEAPPAEPFPDDGLTADDADTGRMADEDHYPLYDGADQILRENAAACSGTAADRQPGEYTLEDLRLLDTDHYVELIDGVYYHLNTPKTAHQIITGELYRMFCNAIEGHGCECTAFISPYGVQLDRDDRTWVIPDVTVLCDQNQIREEGMFGAPDLVAEVLSPSTRSKDMFLKLTKYRNAGVREYWIVDPDKRKVIVYLFGEDEDVSIYGFDDTIPVSLCGGSFGVDFSRIHALLRRLLVSFA